MTVTHDVAAVTLAVVAVVHDVVIVIHGVVAVVHTVTVVIHDVVAVVPHVAAVARDVVTVGSNARPNTFRQVMVKPVFGQVAPTAQAVICYTGPAA